MPPSRSNSTASDMGSTTNRRSLELFGGNSNWRGPIWFSINFLIIESMQRFHHYYGDDFRIDAPSDLSW